VKHSFGSSIFPEIKAKVVQIGIMLCITFMNVGMHYTANNEVTSNVQLTFVSQRASESHGQTSIPEFVTILTTSMIFLNLHVSAAQPTSEP
jgi:hypothetical protein